MSTKLRTVLFHLLWRPNNLQLHYRTRLIRQSTPLSRFNHCTLDQNFGSTVKQLLLNPYVSLLLVIPLELPTIEKLWSLLVPASLPRCSLSPHIRPNCISTTPFQSSLAPAHASALKPSSLHPLETCPLAYFTTKYLQGCSYKPLLELSSRHRPGSSLYQPSLSILPCTSLMSYFVPDLVHYLGSASAPSAPLLKGPNSNVYSLPR